MVISFAKRIREIFYVRNELTCVFILTHKCGKREMRPPFNREKMVQFFFKEKLEEIVP